MRDLDDEDFFFPSDITETISNKKNDFNLRLPWGLPVRYHDFQKFKKLTQPKLWEFHLSYADMELDPKNFIDLDNNVDFVIHAPELFAGSHLMDLTTPNREHRSLSLIETQKVIDITRNLNNFFPRKNFSKIKEAA